MVSAFAYWWRRTIRRFAKGERGSVTVDFVIALPMLIAVLILAAEYGRILQLQSALEKSTNDVATTLSLLPLDDQGGACTFSTVNPDRIANDMISAKMRTGDVDDSLTVSVNVACGVDGGTLSSPFNRITVTGTWAANSPLLRLLAGLDPTSSGFNPSGNFRITAQVFARHSGI